jgi:hypothetical protein
MNYVELSKCLMNNFHFNKRIQEITNIIQQYCTKLVLGHLENEPKVRYFLFNKMVIKTIKSEVSTSDFIVD